MIHDFAERLEFSLGENKRHDENIIRKIIPNCVKVEKTNVNADKGGIDYVAYLPEGGRVNIDVKTRDKGASKYWKQGEPELALEVWSVCPKADQAGKSGWTLSTGTQVDYILYKFHEQDSNKIYILPYQQLRMSFIRNNGEWIKRYGVKRQDSGKWQSEAVFVPASVVIEAIKAEMQGVLNSEQPEAAKITYNNKERQS